MRCCAAVRVTVRESVSESEPVRSSNLIAIRHHIQLHPITSAGGFYCTVTVHLAAVFAVITLYCTVLYCTVLGTACCSLVAGCGYSPLFPPSPAIDSIFSSLFSFSFYNIHFYFLLFSLIIVFSRSVSIPSSPDGTLFLLVCFVASFALTKHNLTIEPANPNPSNNLCCVASHPLRPDTAPSASFFPPS